MIKFECHPDIAVCKSEFDPSVHKTYYRYDYARMFADINKQPDAERAQFANQLMRFLFKNDLFAIVFFLMEIPPANHPFIVSLCHEVEEGGLHRTGTLDIYAREHFKSTLLTMGLTLKRIFNNPECTTAIFSFKKPAADKFLMGIKETLEKPVTIAAFPDICYEKPDTQSPSWSIQNGIRVKRSSASRKENTVEAFGLVEGMPTGGHFDHRIYDDVETADLCENPDQMDKCFSRFEMSDNLGTNGGTEMIIGTFYHHCGPLVRIRDKQTITGEPMYRLNLKPATDDGTVNGKPVFLTQERLDKLKMSAHFNTQQLCNPVPSTDITLDFSMVNMVEPQFVPGDLFKFMVIDPAGVTDNSEGRNDKWAMCVIGVKPEQQGDVAASSIYLLDIIAEKMSHAESIHNATQMYLRNGMILQLGVEKTSQSSAEVHIVAELRKYGRFVSQENGSLVILKPAGRKKEDRISSALQWPLCNNRVFMSKSIHDRYIEEVRTEMLKFPFYHVDILDAVSYVYDMIKTYRFDMYQQQEPLRCMNYGIV